MSDEIILYDYDASPCVRRVKITLIEKGLPFKLQTIDLSKMQQKNPAYLAINPNGLVPTLSHNGRVIFESGVITDYLEDQFPKISLNPPTEAGRIQVRRWQTYELAMAKTYRTLMYARVMGPLHRLVTKKEEFMAIARQATDNPGHLAWEEKIWDLKVLSLTEQQLYRKSLYRFIDLVEKHLETRTYLVDEQFSYADIAVYPRLTMYEAIGISINPYDFPNVCAWVDRIKQRRSIHKTAGKTEKSVAMMQKSGFLDWVNRVTYRPETRSFKDNLLAKAVRNPIRKALKVKKPEPNSSNEIKNLIVPSKNLETPAMAGTICKMPKALQDEPLQLYGYSRSPITRRLTLLLDLLKLKYEFVEVDMAQLKHKVRPYIELNPSAELPLMLHGGEHIHDSILMAEYLSSVDTNLNLFSQDSFELAQIRMWNAFDMGMHKEFRDFFFAKIAYQGEGADFQLTEEEVAQLTQDDLVFIAKAAAGNLLSESDRAAKLSVFAEKMDYLESQLTGKSFLVGERLTYADLALYTRIESFPELGIESALQDKPAIAAWRKTMAQLISEGGKGLRPIKTKAKKQSSRGKTASQAKTRAES